MNLQPYPTYKPSGIDWLGDVPSHWDVRRLLHAGESIIGLTYSPQDVVDEGQGTLVLRASNILDGRINYQDNVFVNCPIPERLVVNVGDILICSRSGSRALIGKNARIDSETAGATFGAFMTVFRSDYNDYLHHVFNSKLFENQSGAFLTSTINQLTLGILNNFKVPWPPADEQAAIVRYLDEADDSIRRGISAKERLIELLTEQRQAVIHRAVTRGLDPNVRFKDSGVEWLGEVPEHWEISRTKHEFTSLNRLRVPLSSEQRGTMTTRRYDYYGASGAIDKVEDYIFDDELLLIAEDGANLVLRNLPLAIIARGKFWVNNHAHILKPKRGNLEFLAAIMERLDYSPWISGAAQPKLTQERLMNIAIAVPSRAEQDEIIASVSAQTTALSKAIDNAQRQIDLLRDYLTRLIADVVTGRVDVQGDKIRMSSN